MKYLFAGTQSKERLELLLRPTKIKSECIKSALYDHLVSGFDVSNAASMNDIAQQNLDRALIKLEVIASIFEEVKELDEREFSLNRCKCKQKQTP